MTEDQALGIEPVADGTEFTPVPEPVGGEAAPTPFEDLASGSDWNAAVEDAPELELVQDEPPMPDDFGAAVPSGDTSEALPGDTDPTAPSDVALPLDDGSLMPQDLGAGVPSGATSATSEPPPSAFDPNAPAIEAPPVPTAGPAGLPPADVAPVTPTDAAGQSASVLLVDGALVDGDGDAVEAVAAGLWHDGSTVYDANGGVVWTGNSPIAQPIDVPEPIASFMATTAAIEVQETLPPALPTIAYTHVPEDDALRLVQQLVGPATGDTYGALLDQLGSLSSDGTITTDEFGAFLVDHASDLGALTIPAGIGDPAALQQLTEQFGSDGPLWTHALASAVWEADASTLAIGGTAVGVSGDELQILDGRPDPTTTGPDLSQPGSSTDADGSSRFAIYGQGEGRDHIVDEQTGQEVTPEQAGLSLVNGDVVDPDGNVVWSRHGGLPEPAALEDWLATQDGGVNATESEPTLQQLLDRQRLLHEQVSAMAAAAGITIDPALMTGHEQWIAQTEATLAEHEESLVRRIGLLMNEQPVHILTSTDGGPPAPVTVTRIEPDRIVAEREDGATVVIEAARLESAVEAAAEKSDGGGDSGLPLLAIGGAIVVPAVVAGGVVASRRLRTRRAVAS